MNSTMTGIYSRLECSQCKFLEPCAWWRSWNFLFCASLEIFSSLFGHFFSFFYHHSKSLWRISPIISFYPRPILEG